MGDGEVRHVRAVERALDILDIFLEQKRDLSLTEVARLTRLPKSTTHRLLQSLSARRYVQRSGSDKYTLGERFTQAAAAPAVDALIAVAQPVLVDLRDTCGETVGLHRRVGWKRVCVAAAEGVRSLRTSGRVGSEAPLHSGASSKAILAFLAPHVWEEAMAATGLASLTANTVTDPTRLRAELELIRQQGYALSHGEWGEGITSLAAPIFDRNNEVVASINISGPSLRFSPEKVDMLVGALKAAAALISQRLGGDVVPDGESEAN